jgi:hypothetical protein
MADAAPIDSLLDILELVDRIERQTGGLTRKIPAGSDVQMPHTVFSPLGGGQAR